MRAQEAASVDLADGSRRRVDCMVTGADGRKVAVLVDDPREMLLAPPPGAEDADPGPSQALLGPADSALCPDALTFRRPGALILADWELQRLGFEPLRLRISLIRGRSGRRWLLSRLQQCGLQLRLSKRQLRTLRRVRHVMPKASSHVLLARLEGTKARRTWPRTR